MGSSYRTAHEVPRLFSGCLRIESQVLDCFIVVQTQRNPYLLTSLVTQQAVLQLFVCDSCFSFEQLSHFGKAAEEAEPATGGTSPAAV